MAEADLIPYAWVVFTGIILAGILDHLRKNRIKREIGKVEETLKIPHYSTIEKKNFKKAIPIGTGLGILVYLQHFVVMFGGQSPWFLPFIQIHPIVLYLTLLFTFAIFKFFVAFTNISFFEKNRGRADGIFASFTAVQIIVFVRFPLEFFPIAK